MKNSIKEMIKYSSMVLFSTFLGISVANAATKWSAYTYAPSVKLPSAAHLEKMASEMSDSTGGELELQANLGGSLPIKVPDIGQAVADGVIQLGFDAYFQGFIPNGDHCRLHCRYIVWMSRGNSHSSFDMLFIDCIDRCSHLQLYFLTKHSHH